MRRLIALSSTTRTLSPRTLARRGSAGGGDVSGARTVKSLFAETTIPVLSMLDINLAGRYDDYNDFGTTEEFLADLCCRLQLIGAVAELQQ